MVKHSRLVLASVTAVAAATFIAGCGANSSGDPNASTPATGTASGSPASSPTGGSAGPATCTLASVKKAIPTDVRVLKFQCTKVGDDNWAVVTTNPGPTVFFLDDKSGSWTAHTAEQVCGTASAGLPAEILNYCPA